MKSFLRLVAVSFFLLSSIAQALWSSTVAVNPTSGQVLVDTGAVAGPSQIEWCAFLTADVAVTVSIQKRNSANSATVQEQYLAVAANTSNFICAPLIVLLNNERIRIVSNASVTGTVSVSLFTKQ